MGGWVENPTKKSANQWSAREMTPMEKEIYREHYPRPRLAGEPITIHLLIHFGDKGGGCPWHSMTA